MADFNDFLIDLSKQLNLLTMNDAQRARFKEYKDKKIGTKDQMSWDLTAPIPDFKTEIPDTDNRRDIYEKFQSVFYDISDNIKDFKDKTVVKEFVDKFYGPGLAVEKFEVNPTVATLIDSKKTELTNYLSNTNVSAYLRKEDPTLDREQLNKFITKLSDGSYKTDKKQLKRLQKIVDILNYSPEEMQKKGVPEFSVFIEPLPELISNAYAISKYLSDSGIINFFTSLGIEASIISSTASNLRSGHFTPKTLRITQQLIQYLIAYESDLIAKGLTPFTIISPDQIFEDKSQSLENITKPRKITDDELDRFDNAFSDIIKTLIKKEDVLNAFNTYNSDIASNIFIAKNKTNFSDPNSKNYLPPKYDDRKRLLDRAKDKVKKWKDDVFGRWTARHKRHIYSTNASYIVGEIIKNKIKPTDGLAKILENKDKIKSALAPKAKDDFKYFTDVLEKLSKTKAFAEATKDGDQMRYIVQEIIIDAVHNGKEKEAKTALETLAMVRYGASTSSIRDNLKKANSEMSIFSDKSLSFNNNGFMRGLTTAIDKTMQATVRAGFETANFLKNKLVRQKGVKFKNGTNRIKQAAKSIDYRNPANKAKFEELFAFWDFVNSSISKDYNPFMKHSAIQKKNTKDITVGGVTTRLIDQKFEDFYRTHNIGR